MQLKFLRKVERRLKRHLMLRTGRLNAGAASHIAGTGGFVHIHVQIRIRSSQAPGRNRSPRPGDFGSLGYSAKSIAKLRRKQQVSGARAGFDERLPDYVLAK